LEAVAEEVPPANTVALIEMMVAFDDEVVVPIVIGEADKERGMVVGIECPAVRREKIRQLGTQGTDLPSASMGGRLVESVPTR
jgi:hypothetical protein